MTAPTCTGRRRGADRSGRPGGRGNVGIIAPPVREAWHLRRRVYGEPPGAGGRHRRASALHGGAVTLQQLRRQLLAPAPCPGQLAVADRPGDPVDEERRRMQGQLEAELAQPAGGGARSAAGNLGLVDLGVEHRSRRPGALRQPTEPLPDPLTRAHQRLVGVPGGGLPPGPNVPAGNVPPWKPAAAPRTRHRPHRRAGDAATRRSGWPGRRWPATSSIPVGQLGLIITVSSAASWSRRSRAARSRRRLGAGRMLRWAAALTAVGIAGQALAPNQGVLLLFVLVLGIGAGFLDGGHQHPRGAAPRGAGDGGAPRRVRRSAPPSARCS